MGKIILIASGKGGTGKTTAAANISAALSDADKLTAAVDMDIGLRNLDIALGAESAVVYDLGDVAEGRCDLDEALIKDAEHDNLYILSAPQTKSAADFNAESFNGLWERLKDRFDYCVIDAPAGICGGFEYALPYADTAVVISAPETSALRDADRVISVIEDSGVNDIRLILNRIRPELMQRGIMMNADDCADMLQIPVLGIVPEDETLREAALKGSLAVSIPGCRAGTAFNNIARRLLGDDVPVMDFEAREGFFVKLKRLFKG